MHLADRQGLAAVTVRRVSDALGTSGGALYRYVSSRDELLDLMVNAASAELPATVPAHGEPVRDLVALGEDLLALYRSHPWLTEVRQSVSTPGPHVLDHLERCLNALAPASVDLRRKMEAIALLTGVVTLFAQHAASGATTRIVADDAHRWPNLFAALHGTTPSGKPGADLFSRVLTGALTGVLADA